MWYITTVTAVECCAWKGSIVWLSCSMPVNIWIISFTYSPRSLCITGIVQGRIFKFIYSAHIDWNWNGNVICTLKFNILLNQMHKVMIEANIWMLCMYVEGSEADTCSDSTKLANWQCICVHTSAVSLLGYVLFGIMKDSEYVYTFDIDDLLWSECAWTR